MNTQDIKEMNYFIMLLKLNTQGIKEDLIKQAAVIQEREASFNFGEDLIKRAKSEAAFLLITRIILIL